MKSFLFSHYIKKMNNKIDLFAEFRIVLIFIELYSLNQNIYTIIKYVLKSTLFSIIKLRNRHFMILLLAGKFMNIRKINENFDFFLVRNYYFNMIIIIDLFK